MANTTPTIGLDDIAFGFGTTVVPTYGDHTRTIRKVNLHDLPFSETKTLADILTEFNDVLNGAGYEAIRQNIQGLSELVAELDDVKRVSFALNRLTRISEALDQLKLLASNVDMFKSINPQMKRLEQLHNDLKYVVDKQATAERQFREEMCEVRNLVHNTLEPMLVEIRATKAKLDTLVSTVRQQILSGNELVAKFGSYRLKVTTLPQCASEDKFIIDDSAQTITWALHRPICATTRPKVTKQEILDACGSCSGEVIDEIVTVDDLEPQEVQREAKLILLNSTLNSTGRYYKAMNPNPTNDNFYFVYNLSKDRYENETTGIQKSDDRFASGTLKLVVGDWYLIKAMEDYAHRGIVKPSNNDGNVKTELFRQFDPEATYWSNQDPDIQAILDKIKNSETLTTPDRNSILYGSYFCLYLVKLIGDDDTYSIRIEDLYKG